MYSTKSFFERLKELDSKVDEEYAKLDYLKGGLFNGGYSERVQTSPTSDGVGNIVVRIQKQAEIADDTVDKYCNMRFAMEEVFAEIDKIDKRYSRIIEKRYAEEKTMMQVADELNISRKHTYSLLERARTEFEYRICNILCAEK